MSDKPGSRVRAAKRAVLTLALLSGLAGWFHRDLVRHFTTRIEHLGDPALNAWILAWNLHAFGSPDVDPWDAPLFHPRRQALTYSENLLAPALLASPAALVDDNPHRLYNTSFLTGVILSGFFMALLCRRVTGSTVAALAGAIVFTFAPFKLAHTAHIQIQHAQWIPLALLFLLAALRAGAPPRLRRGALAGFALCPALLFCSNVYYCLYAIPILLLAHGILWIGLPRAEKKTALIEGAAAWALAAVLVFPFARPYMQLRETAGMVRDIDDVIVLSADVLDYLRFHPASRWFFDACLPPVAYPAEKALTPGPLTMLLALIPAAAAWRHPRRSARALVHWLRGRGPAPALLLWGAIALAGFALSLGPVARCGEIVLGDGPYEWLYEHAPGYDGLRAPARFAVFALLGVGVLASMGSARLLRDRGPLCAALIAFALIAGLVVQFDSEPVAARLAIRPSDAHEAMRTAAPGPFAAVPFPESADRFPFNLEAMLHGMAHWRPAVNGYSGYIPPFFHAVSEYARPWSSPRARRIFDLLGVRHLVVRGPVDPAAIVGLDGWTVAGRFDGELWLVREGPVPPRSGRDSEPWTPLPIRAAEASETGRGRPDASHDGDLSTAWRSRSPQSESSFLSVLFDRPVELGAVRVRFGDYAAEFPRRLRLILRFPDGAERAAEARCDPVRVVQSLLDDPRGGDAVYEFAPRVIVGLRLEPAAPSPRRWAVAELDGRMRETRSGAPTRE
jgi:hypothetical protein